MSWRRGGGGDGGVSKRWVVLLSVGSFYLGLLFTNSLYNIIHEHCRLEDQITSEKHIKDKLHVATL